MKRTFLIIILLFSVFVLSGETITVDHYLIPKNYANSGQYERLYNLLISFPEFSLIMEGKVKVEAIEYYKLFFLATYKTGNWELAWNTLQILREIFPDSEYWKYFSGRVLYFLKEYKRSLEEFSQISSDSPLYPFSLYGMMDSYLALGEYRRVLAIANYCLETFGDKPYPLYCKAKALAGLKQWKSAYRNMEYLLTRPSLLNKIEEDRLQLEMQFSQWK